MTKLLTGALLSMGFCASAFAVQLSAPPGTGTLTHRIATTADVPPQTPPHAPSGACADVPPQTPPHGSVQ